MPSLVKVSVGNSFSTLLELAAVSVHPRDTVVTLLADLHEVSAKSEQIDDINVRFDCKYLCTYYTLRLRIFFTIIILYFMFYIVLSLRRNRNQTVSERRNRL